jgi:hypothetical protein
LGCGCAGQPQFEASDVSHIVRNRQSLPLSDPAEYEKRRVAIETAFDVFAGFVSASDVRLAVDDCDLAAQPGQRADGKRPVARFDLP